MISTSLLTLTLTLMMSGCRSCRFKCPNSNSSNRRLKQLTVSPSTTCGGSLFQPSTTRLLKKSFLMFGWLLSLNGLYLWPRRLYILSLRLKNFALSIDSLPDRIFYASIRSPRSLLFSSVVKSSRWGRSLYVKCLNSGTNFVAVIFCLQLADKASSETKLTSGANVFRRAFVPKDDIFSI